MLLGAAPAYWFAWERKGCRDYVFGVGGGGKGPQSCCEPVKEHSRIDLFGAGGNETVEAAVRTLKGKEAL